MGKIKNIGIAFMVFVLLLPMTFAAEDLPQVDAGIVPGSIFYGLDRAAERVEDFIVTGDERQAAVNLKHAMERLAEIEQVGDPKTITDLNNDIDTQIMKTRNIQVRLQDENIDRVQGLVAQAQQRRVEVLTSVEQIVPQEAKEQIRKVIDKVSDETNVTVLQQIDNNTSTPLTLPFDSDELIGEFEGSTFRINIENNTEYYIIRDGSISRVTVPIDTDYTITINDMVKAEQLFNRAMAGEQVTMQEVEQVVQVPTSLKSRLAIEMIKNEVNN